jgi:predicted transcriptional regulator
MESDILNVGRPSFLMYLALALVLAVLDMHPEEYLQWYGWSKERMLSGR